MSVRIRITTLLLLSYLIAVALMRELGPELLFILLQPLIIWIVVYILDIGVPQSLRKMSKDNVYRLDGTKSESRRQAEASAATDLRLNLYLIITYATLGLDAILVVFRFVLFESIDHQTARTVAYFLLLMWTALAVAFVRHGYLFLLQEYSYKIRQRKESYLDHDISTTQKDLLGK